MPSVRLIHMLIAILFNPGHSDESGSAEPEPISSLQDEASMPEIPIQLPELNDDILHTIFAHLAGNGALPLGPCLFVCHKWRDLIYATKTLWSTIMVDGEFYRYFASSNKRLKEHRVVPFIHTCITRSHPAEMRLSWDWDMLARYGCSRFGPVRRPLMYIETWVTGAITLNSNDAFKRCRDLTLTWEPDDSYLHKVIAGAIDELPVLRKLVIRNRPSKSDALNNLLRRSRNTLEEFSIEDNMGWMPMEGDNESFPSLQRLSIHNTWARGPDTLLGLERFLFVKHLSLGSRPLATSGNVWGLKFDSEGNVLPNETVDPTKLVNPPAESVKLPHLISLHVWGEIPSSVLQVLSLPNLADLYVEQDKKGMTSLLQMTSTRIPSQIKRLRVVASSEFASGSWDSDLNSFLERVGETLESIMIEKWMEERVMEKVPGNLTSGCKFEVLVAP